MKWNPDVLECQVFVDAECGYNVRNASSNETQEHNKALPSIPSNAILRKYEISLRDKPISFLSPIVTLDRSKLLTLDLTKANAKQVQKLFCSELNVISRRYSILKRKRLMLKHGSTQQSIDTASSKNTQIVSNSFVMILFLNCCTFYV